MSLVDAHCHLANLAETMPVPEFIKEAQAKGIRAFISSMLKRRDIDWHRENPDPCILIQAGIHPSFYKSDLRPEDISSLAEVNLLSALGEIGLDRNNKDLDWQKAQLVTQLNLARDVKLPVCLHIVGHQNLIYTYLKHYNIRYLVHGYAGSLEGFELLCRLDSCFTISSRILREDKRKLLESIIASGRYLFETDITRYYVHEGEANPLLRLLDLFEKVKALTGISEKELLMNQDENLEHFLGRAL